MSASGGPWPWVVLCVLVEGNSPIQRAVPPGLPIIPAFVRNTGWDSGWRQGHRHQTEIYKVSLS